jgi:hypothetical protein
MGRGYQPFIDAVRQGKLNVDDLNAAMKSTADAGHIEKLREDTMRWSDTWKMVKNRIDDVAKSLGALTVFNTVQEVLRDASGYRPPAMEHPGYVNPDLKPGPVSSLFPSIGPNGQVQIPGGNTTQPGGPGPGQAPLAPGLANSPLGPLLQWRAGLPPNTAPPPGPSLEDQLADDPDKVKTPHVPYPAGYGAPPAPGESQEHWRLRMEALEKQHDVAEAQAKRDDLEKNHTDKQEEIVAARQRRSEGAASSDTAQRQLSAYLGPKPEVPYGPGYGAAPRPGETTQVYGAEQGLLEAQHKRAEAEAVWRNCSRILKPPTRRASRPPTNSQPRSAKSTKPPCGCGRPRWAPARNWANWAPKSTTISVSPRAFRALWRTWSRPWPMWLRLRCWARWTPPASPTSTRPASKAGMGCWGFGGTEPCPGQVPRVRAATVRLAGGRRLSRNRRWRRTVGQPVRTGR